MKNKIVPIISIVIYAFVLWYFMLPPINLSSPLFWLFIFLVLMFAIIVLYFANIKTILYQKYVRLDAKDWPTKVFAGIFIVIALILVINFVNSPMFNSKKYATRITVEIGRAHV